LLGGELPNPPSRSLPRQILGHEKQRDEENEGKVFDSPFEPLSGRILEHEEHSQRDEEKQQEHSRQDEIGDEVSDPPFEPLPGQILEHEEHSHQDEEKQLEHS
jgi:hypothetical protein